MERPTNKCRNYSLNMGLCNFETELSLSNVEPIPYKCSLSSISSGLQLYHSDTRSSTGQNEPRIRKNNKIIEKRYDQKEDTLTQFDPTKDLLYIASTIER